MFALLRDVEIQVLGLARADAAELARRGDVAAAYECLAVGLLRAQEFAEDGEPWAEELVQRYQRELGDFSARYGVLRA